MELNRRLLEGYTHFKDEPRVQKLRGDVLKYNRLVRDLGLRDHQVDRSALQSAYFSHICPGAQSAESKLENLRVTWLQACSVDSLDITSAPWYNPQWSNVHLGVNNIKEKGKRYVQSIL